MKLSDGLFLATARDVARGVARDRLRREDRRRRVHAPGDAAVAIRRDAPAEPVRRHRLGPVRGAGRRPRPRAGRESRRSDRGVRGRARQRARHRRQEHRQSDGAAAVGADDARAHRRDAMPRHGFAPRWAASSPPAACAPAISGGTATHARSSPLPSRQAVCYSPLLCDPRTCPCSARRARTSPSFCRTGTARRPPIRASASRCLDELKTRSGTASIARCSIRSIRSCARSSASASTSSTRGRRTSRGRVIYVSNHKSHLDYLIEPLVLDDNGVRPPLLAAGINLFGGALGLHPPPRHWRDSDPAQQQGSGVPGHAARLHRRSAEAARPALLRGRRTQLQRRAEAAEDRPAAGGAPRRSRTSSRSCRWRSRTTSCSRIGCWLARRCASSRGRSPRKSRRLVRHAVGYRSRAFVTFGAADPAVALRSELAPRPGDARARVQHAIGLAYKVLPTALVAAVMRPQMTRADLEDRVGELHRRRSRPKAPTSPFAMPRSRPTKASPVSKSAAS